MPTLLLRATRLTLARVGVLVTCALRPSSERVAAGVLAALGLDSEVSTAHDRLMSRSTHLSSLNSRGVPLAHVALVLSVVVSARVESWCVGIERDGFLV